MDKMSFPFVCILSLFLISGALAVGKYSRIASYEDEIVVRCPDRTKKTVQILQEHSDVWRRGQESIDLRLKRDVYEAVQSYFPECWVLIEDLEAHVQEAENQMFPARMAEEDVWVQQILEELITPGKQDLATCEKELERLEVKFQTSSTWFKEYHDYGAICLWYSQLSSNNPDLVQYVPSIGKSVEGRDMPAVHITASSDNDRKKIYFQCQIHAREWISGATCMYISEYLVVNYGSDAQVTSFLDSVEFVIVPFVNPDGYAYTWNGDRLWRKNRETLSGSSCIGVDLNRNFPQAWQSREFGQCAEDYGGPSAGSEPETQNIMNYYRQNAPIIGAVDWHSHGQLILRPWGWSNSQTSNDDILGTLGQEMADKIYQVHSQHYTSETSHELYQCFGIASDWFYSDNASSTNSGYRPVAYVIELRDQSTYGFLLPPEQIIPTGEEIVAAVLHFTERVTEHPIVYHRGEEAAATQQQENEPIRNYQSHE